MMRQQVPNSAPSNLPWQTLLRGLAVNVPRAPAPRESWMFRAIAHKLPFAARQLST
jgi:hypothetical protein